MALRAGYIGIKKSMLGLINTLGSAKLIKSVGDGLNLNNSGKLTMTPATTNKIGGVKVGDGLMIEDGYIKVAGAAGGLIYETEKNIAGSVNGLDYITQLIPFQIAGERAPEWELSGGSTWINENFTAGDIDLIMKSQILTRTAQNVYALTSGVVTFDNNTGIWSLNFSAAYDTYILIDYLNNKED